MPDEQFEFMREVLAAPSPVGFEASMTQGVIRPHFESSMPEGWALHEFRGNAGLVLDTHPGADEMFTVMIIGHADKIRMQVRSIGEDGKIWINSDSFLPTTLIGHEVKLFSQHPDEIGTYRMLEGGTVEALGAIHFAPRAFRTGDKGIKSKMLYLELQIHGDDKKKQIEELGIRPGDPIILDRKIKRGFSPDTFYGAYLDNGLGCFVTAEIARVIAEAGGLDDVRALFTIATHEEIGRFGSRVLAGEFDPDVVIGVDVAHDYDAAPNIGDRRMEPVSMSDGFTLTNGSVTSAYLNNFIEKVARDAEIPMQHRVAGRDTGTDAMAGFLASIDAATTSIGFPIRNMHTISETGHTGDVLASVHALARMLQRMDDERVDANTLRAGHPRLDGLEPIVHVTPSSDEEEE
jgi:endoglucanase